MKVLLTIRFDGTSYVGYQAQNNGPTVQKELTRAAEELFGYPCDITGCSRTDSGVHANRFYVTVEKKGTNTLETSIPVERIPRAMSAHLPESISVLDAQWVREDFHARYSVLSKEYVYRIHNAPWRDPFEAGKSWHIPQALDENALAAMQDAANAFVGKQDFTSCMANGSKIVSAVRTVLDAKIERRGDLVEFRVSADGFLYHMVRIMMGTLVEVGMGRMTPEDVKEALAAMDRRYMGPTAPACGLYLNRVDYDMTGEYKTVLPPREK